MSNNGSITWTNEQRKLCDLIPWEHNPRQINRREAERLGDSLAEFGQIQTIAVGPDNEILDGNQRQAVWSLLPQFGPDHLVDVRVASRTLTDKERQRLVVYLHRGTVGSWNFDLLANEFDVPDLLEWGFEESELQLDWGSDVMRDPDAESTLSRRDVPDARFPSDNEWDVPLLNIARQALAVDLPVNTWGASGRKEKMRGTYHFYTDDYRFEGLWGDPSPVVNSGCVNAVEPNISTNVQMPRAVVLWHTYRKRWMARWWQESGIKIFVDLDVHPDLQAINLLGVPDGWRSYACYMRQSDHKDEELLIFCETARAKCGGDDFILLVVGGNERVQAMARKIPQIVWVASFDQKFYHNYKPGGGGGG